MNIHVEKSTETLNASHLTFEVESKRLLNEVSITISPGELLGVIGPNGAGKTTLLRLMAGILKPKSGSVLIDGASISDMSVKEVAKKVALISQVPGFTFGFTCFEIVMMGRYPFMGRLQVESTLDKKIALGAMRATDTEQFMDRTMATLSGGERQRVFLARALSQQPRVMLLDEPTANLDISHQLKLFQIVKGLTSSGMSAIAAIHDISLAARYCDKLLILNRGSMLAFGTPKDVLTYENIALAFGVEVNVYTDSVINSLALSVIRQIPQANN
ncbi:MAG: ABC transporter ATP-binding protein [Dehalococcoidia bacterium]|nr:ABC transporter ATP-binding protein [Dehalococcoidia bacterium]